MDLRQRLARIDQRLHALETSSRLRSASISEGITEFTADGALTVEEGGTLTVDAGGVVESDSWGIGVDSEGKKYAHLGDVLLFGNSDSTASVSVHTKVVPVSMGSQYVYQVPDGTDSSVIVGAINVVALPTLNSVLKASIDDEDISLVVLAGTSVSVPILHPVLGSSVSIKVTTTKCEVSTVNLVHMYNKDVL